MKQIAESDWKIFREIHPVALARFCERILGEVMRLADDTGTPSHERYLLVYKLIQQRETEIADAFNDMRRSTAYSWRTVGEHARPQHVDRRRVRPLHPGNPGCREHVA